MTEFDGKIVSSNATLKVGPQINCDTVFLFPQLAKNDIVKVLERTSGNFDESWYYVKTKENVFGYLPTYKVMIL